MAPRSHYIESQQITRPANTTAYGDGDLVANDATAGNVTPFKFENVVPQTGYQAKIKRAGIFSQGGTVITNGTFRVHLFTAEPVVANGDNGALSVPFANQASYLGYLDAVLAVTSADGPSGWSLSANSPIVFKSAASKHLWALVQAKGAYTPASGEKFQLKLEVERG